MQIRRNLLLLIFPLIRIAALNYKKYARIYLTISHSKIKYNVFEMLAVLEKKLYPNFPPIYGNMTQKVAFLVENIFNIYHVTIYSKKCCNIH